MSRPSKFTNALADEICEAIANTSKGLHILCDENDHWPSSVTIYSWLKSNQEFLNKYTRARELQADLLADEIIEIADDSSYDIKKLDDGREVVDHENINRSRLRVDARKWIASKLAPKKYGDKLEIDTKDKISKIKIDWE